MSGVAPATVRGLLGFGFLRRSGRVRVRLERKTRQRLKARLRALTSRRRSIAMPVRLALLNRFLAGWTAYFALAETPSVFDELDEWLRRRLRQVRWKEWKRFAARRRNLRALGIPDVALGIDHLLAFATAVGTIDPARAKELRERCWRALLDAASDQRSHQAASEPAARFIELLAAAVAAGRAHLADEEGDRPANPGAWGWRRVPEGAFANESWRPMGGASAGWLTRATTCSSTPTPRSPRRSGWVATPGIRWLSRRGRSIGASSRRASCARSTTPAVA
jgi:hypothetical protein